MNYYRRNYPLTVAARASAELNPGNGSVSRLCHEPRVALAVLYEMLAPFLASGRVSVLLDHLPVRADVDGDIVRSVSVRHIHSGDQTVLRAPYFVDATELGDLLPLTGTEYVTGFESQHDTGEPHAPEEKQSQNMQAITWCFPMEYVPGQDFVGAAPGQYEFWKNYLPRLTPPWPGTSVRFHVFAPYHSPAANSAV